MPKRKMRSAALAALFVLFVEPAGHAGIPGASPWATEATQLLNYAELIAVVAAQAETIRNTLGILNQAVIDGELLASFPFSPIRDDLLAIYAAQTAANGIAYTLAQLDQQFADSYQPYDPGAGGTYYDSYNSWYAATMETVQGTLRRAGLNIQQVMDEQDLLGQLQFLAGTSEGRNQAIQVGNVIAGETLSAILRLQTIMTEDMQAKASYTGYLLNQDEAKATADANALGHVDRDADQKVF